MVANVTNNEGELNEKTNVVSPLFEDCAGGAKPSRVGNKWAKYRPARLDGALRAGRR